MENKVMENAQEFEFKAEMKQLLNLIIHSLYTHPEVFLRELISNSSDALNKLRFNRLTNPNIFDSDADLRIKITLDKDNHTFSIEDSGIGMSKEDLINNIGTVASSGTLNFLKQMKENKTAIDGNMIGQFGVGFYSVYMVTDEVTLETRDCSPDGKGYRWKSDGSDKFTIEEIDMPHRGTKISFKLKEEYKEFADDLTVKNIIFKYSNFVDFPIFVGDEEVNKVTALWQKKKEDITEEELDEFYKFISNDYEKPLGHIVLNIEGNVNFKSILFIPATAGMGLFRETGEKTIHLYSNRVFIQEDAKELLPEYLRFIKGVLDTDDLPLNVSREVTQSSPVMTKIKTVLIGKILGLLEDWAENDKEKYDTFYKNFSPLFKTGLNTDFTHKERLTELLRFETSKLEEGKTISFKEYVANMKSDQKEIYYISGNHRDVIDRNPNLEYFKTNDIEVIYLTDPVDIFTFPYIRDYAGKEVKSIDKADVDVTKIKKSSDESLNEEQTKTLTEKIKEILADRVEDVIESKRLVSSPATIVVGKQGLDHQMEKMMQMMDKEFTASKKILEINPSHKLIMNLSALSNNPAKSDEFHNAVIQLFEGAMLVEGYMKNPGEFVSRMYDFMTKATN